MPASYPGSIKSNFITHVNNTEIIEAAHPNVIQDEVVAIETTLGTYPNQGTAQASTATYDNSGTLFSTVSARLANIEKGIVGDTHTQYLKKTGGTVTGNITMSGATVTGLTSPSEASDAATKSYVDTAVAAGGGGSANLSDILMFSGM